MYQPMTIPNIVTEGKLESIIKHNSEVQLKLTSRANALATVFDQDIKELMKLHEEAFNVQKEAEERLTTIRSVS